MNHGYLLQKFGKHSQGTRVLGHIQQCLNRVEVYHGEHRLITRGVCKGCSLSSLLDALYLLELDEWMEQEGVCSVRTMDNFIILTQQRHQLSLNSSIKRNLCP